MVGIPSDMIEAGMMDGAGTVRSFFHVILPISRPILALQPRCPLPIAGTWWSSR